MRRHASGSCVATNLLLLARIMRGVPTVGHASSWLDPDGGSPRQTCPNARRCLSIEQLLTVLLDASQHLIRRLQLALILVPHQPRPQRIEQVGPHRAAAPGCVSTSSSVPCLTVGVKPVWQPRDAQRRTVEVQIGIHDRIPQEDAMNAKLISDAETLYQTAIRLERVGLVIDRAALSPTQRRAAFALQCLSATCPDRPEPARTPIGFTYPNAR